MAVQASHFEGVCMWARGEGMKREAEPPIMLLDPGDFQLSATQIRARKDCLRDPPACRPSAASWSLRPWSGTEQAPPCGCSQPPGMAWLLLAGRPGEQMETVCLRGRCHWHRLPLGCLPCLQGRQLRGQLLQFRLESWAVPGCWHCATALSPYRNAVLSERSAPTRCIFYCQQSTLEHCHEVMLQSLPAGATIQLVIEITLWT